MALNAGVMVTTVLDVIHNGKDIAILDTSAACHMPDVLELPYTPVIEEVIRTGGTKEGLRHWDNHETGTQYHYRLGGPTCLSGDVMGDYVFDAPLQPGDRILFKDMAIYSMVKTNTFNGMKLPSIAYENEEGIDVIREFGYEDFKMRLS